MGVNYKITLLGCGPSSGVPSINGYWLNCNENFSKNRRTRSCIAVQYNDKTVLIDTSPDLRSQILSSDIKKVDAILYTHAHSDHVLGIHDASFFSKNTISPNYNHRIEEMHDLYYENIHQISNKSRYKSFEFNAENSVFQENYSVSTQDKRANFSHVDNVVVKNVDDFIPVFASCETLCQIIPMFYYMFNKININTLVKNSYDLLKNIKNTSFKINDLSDKILSYTSKRFEESFCDEIVNASHLIKYFFPINGFLSRDFYDYSHVKQINYEQFLNQNFLKILRKTLVYTEKKDDIFFEKVMYDLVKMQKAFTAHIIKDEFYLFGKKILCFEQNHSYCNTTGFRFDKFAYSTDVFELDENAFNQLTNLDLWIISCAKYKNSIAKHADFEKVMHWIDRVKPKKVILTHMGDGMDYESVDKFLPAHVTLAHDGMQVFL